MVSKMKAFNKTIWRTLTKNKGRFAGNVLIVMISIALSAGLASMPDLYEKSYVDNNYTGNNVPDIILKNKTKDGFSDDDIEKIKEDDDIANALPLLSIDYESDDSIYRIYMQDFSSDVGKLTLLEGKKPSETYDFSKNIPILALEGNKNRNIYKIGDTVEIKLDKLSETFDGMDISSVFGSSSLNLEVIGIVSSPLYNSVQRENAMLEGDEEKYINSAFYLDENLLPEKIHLDSLGLDIPLKTLFSYTDIQIVCKGNHQYFSDEYKKTIDDEKDKLVNEFGEEKVQALTLEENVSYNLFKTYNEKVRKITYVFPIFFMVVCGLVNLITISRLIKDERAIIATYLSLGVSKAKIVTKYIIFSVFSALLGGVAGFFIGLPLIPTVVLPAYQSIFEMSSALKITFFNSSGLILLAIVVLLSLLITLYCSLKTFKDTPARLMQAEAPKAGKKIFLERISFIWKKLPFRYKSSFRNIFRQKKNLILTSLSVIGSIVLLMLGFGLLNISDSLKNDALFGNVASSMGLISTIIVLFALAMAVVVVYSLANMNIQDRQREIATLKVLGYHDNECSAYTFREILIISAGAALLGLPIAAGLMAFVFDWLKFGSISDVKWYTYIISYAILIATTFIVNLLLFHKIKEVDMNDSLKTLD